MGDVVVRTKCNATKCATNMASTSSDTVDILSSATSLEGAIANVHKRKKARTYKKKYLDT